MLDTFVVTIASRNRYLIMKSARREMVGCGGQLTNSKSDILQKQCLATIDFVVAMLIDHAVQGVVRYWDQWVPCKHIFEDMVASPSDGMSTVWDCTEIQAVMESSRTCTRDDYLLSFCERDYSWTAYSSIFCLIRIRLNLSLQVTQSCSSSSCV